MATSSAGSPPPAAPGTPDPPSTSGAPDPPGTSGAPDPPGTSGAPDPLGPPATSGLPGLPDPPGTSGTPATSGLPGPPGATGMPGPPGTSATSDPSGTPDPTGTPDVPGHAGGAHRSRLVAGLLGACFIGAGIAVQTRINGALAGRLGDGLVAAVISFGSGLVVVLVLIAVSPSAWAGVRRVRRALTDGELRWWHLTGGLCGGLLIAAQGLASGLIGVAVFSVAMVAGQVSSALLMDKLGVGPAGRQPVNGRRLLGALLAVVAVVLAVADRFGRPTGLALTVLPLLAGLAVAWQQGINGRIGAVARQARPNALGAAVLPATAVNFAVGTVGLVVAAAVGIARHGPPRAAPPELWLYVGGPIGVLFIAAGVLVVRAVGVLLLGLGMVAGQLTSSLLLDALVPSAAHALSVVTVAGTALTLAAAAVAAWPARSVRMAR